MGYFILWNMGKCPRIPPKLFSGLSMPKELQPRQLLERTYEGMKHTSREQASVENIYRLEGRVPVGKAIPFGLQHVLAMFVSNVAPIILVASVALYNGEPFTAVETARLIQNAMMIAGIGTLIQLYPIWKVGSGLPVVMGVSFTFVSAMMVVAARDYGLMVGAIIVGGCIEGVLGLTVKYWRRFVAPIVSACVVTTIGFSLLNVGISSYGASGTYEFGSWQNLLVGTITLTACLVFQALAKGFWKQLYVLFGLAVGYIAAICFGMVDFSSIGATVEELGIISLPMLLHYTPKFQLGAIISVTLVVLVSAAETIGDTTAVCTGGLGRDITEKELSGSLCCDGFISAVSGGLFGCTPITSFSQNVGLVAMTKVVNRFTIMFGALTLVIAGLFPPIGAFFSTLPSCVLGGCTVIMFGAIIVSGVTMVFVPAVSTFYISQKLGSPGSTLIGDVIESQFKTAYNPNLGAAMSLVLMILIFVCVSIMNRFGETDEEEVMAKV